MDEARDDAIKNPAPIGPWTTGLWCVPPHYGVPSHGLTEAVNVDILPTGAVRRRQAWARADATPAHSLFMHNGRVLGVSGGEVGEFDPGGFTPMAPVAGRLSWAVLNAEPVFCDSEQVLVVRGQSVEPLPFDVDEVEAEYVLSPLPGGDFIGVWAGRLVVARGNTLLFSRPNRYGAHDPMRDFVQFEERIFWIAPLDTGIYVGLRNSVRWLQGTHPHDLRQTRVGGATWRGAAAVVDAAEFNDKLTGDVAVWMTPAGFAVGSDTGKVDYPQGGRLEGIPMHAGRLLVLGDRLTVVATQ